VTVDVGPPPPPADRPRRPSPEQLRAAVDLTVPDVIAPDLRLVLCGINPGLWSGATGHHFARPGNRFWRTLHAAGLTDRVLEPWDERALLDTGIGITNLVMRTTATAAELERDELRAGARRLQELAERFRPRVVACLGVSAYRVAFDRKKATIGRQSERLGPSILWVLPNPSGLNAHYQLPELARVFGELRADLDAMPRAGQAPENG
jgi:TDG/mug DNA glycosylase family protein